jgi:prolyl oligopeptidase
MRHLLFAVSAIALGFARTARAEDPYLWLEDLKSARAKSWVAAEDARSLGILTADPHYKKFHDTAKAFAEATDRIPAPELLAGQVYNFWQDAAHTRGIWRRTTIADYRSAKPNWVTVLDIDDLARRDHANWIFKGATCLEPAETRCLIALSDGGEDAVTMREFDLTTKDFVKNGFLLPRAKMTVDWVDANRLAAATDWGSGSMTKSGYPYIVKFLSRGQKLADAKEVFRGTPENTWVQVETYADSSGHHVVTAAQGLDFFHSAVYVLNQGAPYRLALPEKADIYGLLQNQLIFGANQSSGNVVEGSLAALDLGNRAAKPVAIFAPSPRQALLHAAIGKTRVIAAIADNVRGRLYGFTTTATGWTAQKFALPDNLAIDVVSTSLQNDIFYADVTGFLTPDTLWQGDAAAHKIAAVKQLAARFATSDLTVEQRETKSTDGTIIPYFLVHKKDLAYTGKNPTLLYAYGGFQISETPVYSPALGKLWLEQGGVFALGNIRGGGEFGPAWHEAALKTKRQKAWDDFAAVGRDLIARKITSPRYLGIRGGSNGGLLMGVEFTQHPELWNAVIIDVPLLDMMRFEHIAAGASWVGEYGSIVNPAERDFWTKNSPYQNLGPNQNYPEPLIYTTTKDDRVGPQHARKFAARLAEYKKPYFFYEATEGGHSAGVNAEEKAREQALEFTYLVRKLMP